MEHVPFDFDQDNAGCTNVEKRTIPVTLDIFSKTKFNTYLPVELHAPRSWTLIIYCYCDHEYGRTDNKLLLPIHYVLNV